MSNTFTLDELTADLATLKQTVDPLTLELEERLPLNAFSPKQPTASKAPKGFLTAQFPILSTPYFIIYLQGPATWVDSLSDTTSEASLLKLAFANAKARKLGRATTPELDSLIYSSMVSKALFYTDKLWHREMLDAFIGAKAKMEVAKVANRAFPLAAIDQYLNALATFLNESGYSTNTEYLAANTSAKARGTMLSPEASALYNL